MSQDPLQPAQQQERDENEDEAETLFFLQKVRERHLRIVSSSQNVRAKAWQEVFEACKERDQLWTMSNNFRLAYCNRDGKLFKLTRDLEERCCQIQIMRTNDDGMLELVDPIVPLAKWDLLTRIQKATFDICRYKYAISVLLPCDSHYPAPAVVANASQPMEVMEAPLFGLIGEKNGVDYDSDDSELNAP